jgi:hypothetical protein
MHLVYLEVKSREGWSVVHRSEIAWSTGSRRIDVSSHFYLKSCEDPS